MCVKIFVINGLNVKSFKVIVIECFEHIPWNENQLIITESV